VIKGKYPCPHPKVYIDRTDIRNFTTPTILGALKNDRIFRNMIVCTPHLTPLSNVLPLFWFINYILKYVLLFLIWSISLFFFSFCGKQRFGNGLCFRDVPPLTQGIHSEGSVCKRQFESLEPFWLGSPSQTRPVTETDNNFRRYTSYVFIRILWYG
jgi:hypothetical protein